MPLPLVVPDASVILKWVLPSDDEPETSQALMLRKAIVDEDIRALLPALWLYEVGNTITRRFPDHAAGWLAALIKFGLEESPPSRLWLTTVLELTNRYSVTFYDAAYHAIAINHDGQFVTADSRYASRASEAGAIVRLHDWTPPSSG